LAEFPLGSPIKVLLLVEYPQPLNMYYAQQWHAHRRIELWTWGTGPADPQGVPPLSNLPGHRQDPPRPSDLQDEGIDVVVLHDLDPNALENAFWEAVAERVQDGRMGLLVQPGVRTGQAILEHPVLGPLLPVDSELASIPAATPGFSSERMPFRLQEAGHRHPATRLVQWPTWTERIWAERATGDWAWSTPYAFPVARAVEGAEVLAVVEPPRGDDIPILVASAPDRGRVLWVGTWELGDRLAYGQPKVVADWRVLVRNWVIWLAGRVTEPS
jgi:hypothetical protein